ncbi:alanine/glycine:cation symporter family protein [Rodentibacter pneumotropicus]|uniref:Sodium:alanine symporter family protein n=1 Tax=Rodentibacter pneumotropicus TaxID=758 RepID=A0A1V3K3N6_9PAST|nr:sodium:alanine symporter family protein [Rodentibacter pneumotropicus]MCQ9122213.1 sodium:alanine symporter family protein [Rodentibacter pneumotropicus]OOF63502.1 sodium:alanine symporter family protein [Rodentibacter pneumotropicus]OOF67654.1 sodium:alanine symporter family protein [Rodentibacter pneumotropicus]THA07691.1 sodium:alanine symporter family protein [Rodentibacter pneumotropicus]THA17797.1 sodium:alanine symporter family protein [Rodentibacter pneumotropicus]
MELIHYLEQLLVWIVDHLDGPIWNLTIVILLGVGLFFTITTGFVQLRLFPMSIREMWFGRAAEGSSLTPFQAFATGLASRVGVGNIGGVATAIALGGEGAVFWMWITAFIGMSSAFAESTLAQLFKIQDKDGSFRGGPAYYMVQGLKSRSMAVAFAIALIFTFGFAFNSVQSNSIVEATRNAWNWQGEYVGIALVILTAAIIFGGIKRIAVISSSLVPMMALFYLIMAMIILGMNIELVPTVINNIIKSAFTFDAAAGGFFGAMVSKAMMMGIKRGLFSNEAGMGSAPNAAAAAHVKHPVSQGLVQMLGVFVDTMMVCTCTAIVILLSNNYGGEELKSISLTQNALQYHVGEFGLHFLAFILLLFAYSSIIGNYAYAESNIRFIKNKPWFLLLFRLVVLFFVYFGAVRSGNVVWNFADTVMAVMAILNLVAIVLLSPIVWKLLKDYQRQLKAGKIPEFKIENYPELKQRVFEQETWK